MIFRRKKRNGKIRCYWYTGHSDVGLPEFKCDTSGRHLHYSATVLSPACKSAILFFLFESWGSVGLLGCVVTLLNLQQSRQLLISCCGSGAGCTC